MSILLEDLIYQLPSDTEDKVRQAKDRFNARVRDALRRETRLSFHRDERTNVNVPIHVLPGLPEPLQPLDKQTIDDKYRIALLLAPYRRELTSIRDKGRVLAQNLWPLLAQDPAGQALLRGHDDIDGAVQHADFLLRVLSEFELTRFILQVNSDVLGIYRYKVRPHFDEPEPKIELYWGVIGLIARDLGVDAEDLTCVVLAHELAHAYTHVGSDAYDHWWNTAGFHAAEHELAEGLAQFYALLVCKRIADTSPAPLAAFSALVPKHPPAYKTHQRWEQYTPEHVRLAMLEVRRQSGKPTLELFENCLKNAHQTLRRVRAQAASEY